MSDNTFDLVRMPCLTLCITSDTWVFVFQEVCRVLSPGSHLELIDSSSPKNIFPISPTHRLDAHAHRLSASIPSSVFSTFSIYDSNSPNPSLGFAEGEVNGGDAYHGLDQVDEESDTAAPTMPALSRPIPSLSTQGVSHEVNHSATTSIIRSCPFKAK